MSPAMSSVTFSRFFPAATKSPDIRSLLPLLALTRSMDSVIFPDMTRKKATSPRCCSWVVLYIYREGAPLTSQGISSPETVLLPVMPGCGAMSVISSIRRLTPMSFFPETITKGMISHLRNPMTRPWMISSGVRAPFSKNFSINGSSASAARSASSACMVSALSLRSAGMSSSSRLPLSSLKRYIFIFTTSTNELKPAPASTGNCTGQTLFP